MSSEEKWLQIALYSRKRGKGCPLWAYSDSAFWKGFLKWQEGSKNSGLILGIGMIQGLASATLRCSSPFVASCLHSSLGLCTRFSLCLKGPSCPSHLFSCFSSGMFFLPEAFSVCPFPDICTSAHFCPSWGLASLSRVSLCLCLLVLSDDLEHLVPFCIPSTCHR